MILNIYNKNTLEIIARPVISSLEDFKKRVKPNDYDVSEKIRDKSMIKEKNGKLKNIIDDSDKK